MCKEVASSKKTNSRLECKNRYPIYDHNGGKMAIIDTLFMTKTAENHTLWGRTYLYSPYKGVPPPGMAQATAGPSDILHKRRKRILLYDSVFNVCFYIKLYKFLLAVLNFNLELHAGRLANSKYIETKLVPPHINHSVYAHFDVAALLLKVSKKCQKFIKNLSLVETVAGFALQINNIVAILTQHKTK